MELYPNGDTEFCPKEMEALPDSVSAQGKATMHKFYGNAERICDRNYRHAFLRSPPNPLDRNDPREKEEAETMKKKMMAESWFSALCIVFGEAKQKGEIPDELDPYARRLFEAAQADIDAVKEELAKFCTLEFI